MLKEWGWRIMRRSDTKNLSIAEIHVSESGLANAHRVCEYDLENRLHSPGDVEMTCSTSEVAVCCSNASLRRVCAPALHEQTHFSIAIAA